MQAAGLPEAQKLRPGPGFPQKPVSAHRARRRRALAAMQAAGLPEAQKLRPVVVNEIWTLV
jgi:hypothetical protein